MHTALAPEFKFVANLPKREKGRVARALDLVKELGDITEREGPLVPLSLAARVLGISRARLQQLVAGERIPFVLVQSHYFITKAALIAFAETERKAGRPVTPPTKFVDQVKLAWNFSHGK